MEKSTKKSLSLFGDVKVVERRKIWFLIPCVIVAIAMIVGTVMGFVKGAPLNLSMDFTGGYTMTINLGTRLTDDNFNQYKEQINTIATELSDDEGNVYGLKIDQMQHQGLEDPMKASILIRYKAIRGKSSGNQTEFMVEVNKDFKEELDKFFAFIPQVEVNEKTIVASYSSPIPDHTSQVLPFDSFFRSQAKKHGVEIETIVASEDGKTLTVTCKSDITEEQKEHVKGFMSISDAKSGKTSDNDSTSPLVGTELLVGAICAVLLALTLMLIYIAFRFEGSSGFVAVLALLHDIIIMLAFMVIFQVEIGVTFIAALITILGYSITNTIILFDRVREKLRPFAGKSYDPNRVANEAVRDIFKRALITTVTTLIPITVIALIGVTTIRVFAFPIIIGLLTGMFSTLCIAPSVWAMWKNRLIAKAGAVIAPTPRKFTFKKPGEKTNASAKKSLKGDKAEREVSTENGADGDENEDALSEDVLNDDELGDEEIEDTDEESPEAELGDEVEESGGDDVEVESDGQPEEEAAESVETPETDEKMIESELPSESEAEAEQDSE